MTVPFSRMAIAAAIRSSRFPWIGSTRVAASVVGLGLVGCDGGSSPPRGSYSHDSAGIAIVENSSPIWQEDTGWVVDTVPLLDIADDPDDGEDLTGAHSAILLANRSVAVASSRLNTVRMFDRDGRRTATFGRSGAGPGEFQRLSGQWLYPGDSLLAWDAGLQRLTLIGPDGRFGRSFRPGGDNPLGADQLGSVIALPQIAGTMDDGSFVAWLPAQPTQREPGTFGQVAPYFRFRPDGALADSIGTYPSGEFTIGAVPIGGTSRLIVEQRPYGRNTAAATRGAKMYFASNAAWEIEVRGPQGNLERLVRVTMDSVPITEQIKAAYKEMKIAERIGIQGSAANAERVRQTYDAIATIWSFPSRLPWIERILASDDGTLWVEEPLLPGEPEPSFMIIDSTGVWLGRVRLPERFQMTDVRGEVVAGFWKDENDVAHLQTYRIRTRR